jgi:anti-sigma factor RsiW
VDEEDMAGTPANDLTDSQLADLARLADGTLPEERRAEVEAAVAGSPELTRAFESQARAIQALRATADVGAPARLRADVERRQATRGGRRARPKEAPSGAPARDSRWRPSPRTGLIAAAVAATLAVVLLLPAALSGNLTVEDAAAFADKQPTAGAPAGVPGTPQLLREQVGGVPFPDYAAKFGWKAVGVRHDRSHGRDATTVYYRKDGRTLAYTIVSGDALGKPSDARVVQNDNTTTYRALRSDSRTVVTWERGGHTCVISAERATPSELVELADWRGMGAIPF